MTNFGSTARTRFEPVHKVVRIVVKHVGIVCGGLAEPRLKTGLAQDMTTGGEAVGRWRVNTKNGLRNRLTLRERFEEDFHAYLAVYVSLDVGNDLINGEYGVVS